MKGKASTRLLALLLTVVPGSGWGARVVLPPAVVPGLKTTAPLAVSAGVMPALFTIPPNPCTILSPVPALAPSAPALAPAPAAGPAGVAQTSALTVLTQTGGLAHQALQAAAPEAAAAPAAAVFDQTAPGLAGIRRSWGKLYLADRELEVLGEGSFGRVYVHPRTPDVVVKLMTGFSDELARQSAHQDSQVGLRFAQAGVGPAVLGVFDIPDRPSPLRRWLWRLFGREARAPPRPAVAKERVYGETVEDLIAGRRFAPQDYELVMRMLERMADARLKAGDMRPANIIIGRTAANPERRAYLVDGGWLLPVPHGQSREGLLQALKYLQVEILGAGGSAGWANVLDPFDDILQDGLARSRGR